MYSAKVNCFIKICLKILIAIIVHVVAILLLKSGHFSAFSPQSLRFIPTTELMTRIGTHSYALLFSGGEKAMIIQFSSMLRIEDWRVLACEKSPVLCLMTEIPLVTSVWPEPAASALLGLGGESASLGVILLTTHDSLSP